MTTRTVEQVGDWESRSFSGGYRGLQDLSDERFSGIVTAGPTRLCMTKGKVVGVLDGDIEAFEDASGTVHEAPSPALPLLAVMQERSDEVRAQYYTEETPITEVDQTLSDGNFTGYVELSENVLSGDYYIVYHQGRSMNVAWVGESGQLLTEDEAFDRTNGEVGIYKVRPVDIDVLDIPEPSGPAPDDTGDSEPAAADTDSSDDDPEPESDDEPAATADADTAETDDPTATDERSTSGTGATRSEQTPSEPADETGRGSGDQDPSRSQPARTEGPSSAAQTPDEHQQSRTDAEPRGRDGRQRSESSHPQGGAPRGSQPAEQGPGQPGGAAEASAAGHPGADSTQRDAAGAAGATGATGSAGTADAVGELETRSIPSLDPDRTSSSSDESASTSTGEPHQDQATRSPQPSDGARSGPRQQSRQGSRQQTPGGPRQQSTEASHAHGQAANPGQSPAGQQRDADRPPAGETGRADAAAEPGEREQLQSELAEREEEITELESELETVEGERDSLEAELDEVKAERDELEERVERLESRVNELRTEDGGESIADRRRMSPGEVIDGTNLFVRYRSKGDATLEAAYRGNAEPGAVNDNLDIQHHTQFEADDVAVNGEPFAEFLHGTLQFQFVEWAVRVLPYEIRDTGHEGSLGDLYQALPDVDRAELNGAISVRYQEDGEEHRSQERFDVVLRDRMGNPLVVANMNESRQPASQSKMETLITASQRVGESKESLAGSFLVTSSFFEPEAMEAAEDATGSGLLSRDKRESFVKLSRKEGFHLCLVQYLDGQFELSVPEL